MKTTFISRKEILTEKQLIKNMLAEYINAKAFLVWFVENYPESVKVMKENPEYQYNFR